MKPEAYLFFNGDCRAALDTYTRVFGGTVEYMMTAADMPDGEIPGGIPEDRRDWIMHANLRIGEGQLMASDTMTGTSAAMDGCSVIVELPDADQARAAFDALAEGGEITMPFEATFWSPGFGTLRDKFGVRWMIGTETPPEE